MGVLAPLIGVLVDRLGSKKLIFTGVITIGVGLILLSLTRSLLMFYGAFLFLALGAGGCTSLVLMTVVASWFRKNVGKALGIAACGFGAGGALVPLIVRLVDSYDWRTALAVLGIGMWVIGIPLSSMIRDRPEQYGLLPDGDSPTIAVGPETGIHKAQGSFAATLKGRTIWLISLAETVRFIVITAVIIHVMPYLSSIGVSRMNASLVATAIPLLSLTGRFGFGWLGDILDKRRLMAVTYVLVGVGMLAFSYLQLGWTIVPFLLLFPAAYGGGMVLRGAIIREYFGTAYFGKAVGLVMGISSIGGILGPALAGLTFDTFGDYHMIWLLFCLLTVVAVAAILLARKETASD